ncbi:MAG TPA: cobalamin-binding protein [Syntrophobacter fumaroxidans]|mgnify:CR=1 FL=1|nr:cobalamin-binding protein [Syntrophobacter fumaroxidans]
MAYPFSLIVVFFLGLSAMIPWRCEAGMLPGPGGEALRGPDDPTRIVSLAPSITEILFSLGAGHRLAGATDLCDFPSEATLLPKVGRFPGPDLERIVSLRPDLCIALKNVNPADLLDRLGTFGIPVYVVEPKDLSTTMETILELGRLLDAEASAEKLVGGMSSRVERVKSRVAKTGSRPGVFLQIGVTPIVSVGSHTFIDELITVSGGRNLAQGPVPYPRFSREQVLALQPEVIIITSMTRGLVFEHVRDEWREWESLPAVKNQRIFIVDSDLIDRPTARLAEGLEMLAGLIHPELF